MSTLTAVSTTANKAPSKVQLWGNQEATGRQRKPVFRRRQMDRHSLQEKREARGHQVRETKPVTPACYHASRLRVVESHCPGSNPTSDT